MGKFSYGQVSHSSEVLDRVINAYDFTSKLMLADHFGMASSSLAGRYKRGGFPADIVVRCVAETVASLEWLATGPVRKFDDEELDIIKIPRRKPLMAFFTMLACTCWIRSHSSRESLYLRPQFASWKVKANLSWIPYLMRFMTISGELKLKVK
ncbi:hypothetical protein DP202_18215 [Enterobacter cloacae]|uniref:Bacteriophage CI repressor N-terminal domain-containing protein n=1 Tax=Enterobacter cloacae TaxID=550 RepID=A0A330G942_ENTCL|nr:hypothetical protein DP202_18215 [Enterobacter cloacae]